MKLNSRHFITALLILFCSLTVDAQDYAIRFEQPAKAGDKYQLTATSSQSMKITITSGERVVPMTDDSFTVELTAAATVLEVNAKGQPIAKSFTILKSKLTTNGTTQPLLSPFIIAELMGHSDIKMTARYTHPTEEGKRAAVECAQVSREENGHVLVTGRFAQAQ